MNEAIAAHNRSGFGNDKFAGVRGVHPPIYSALMASCTTRQDGTVPSRRTLSLTNTQQNLVSAPFSSFVASLPTITSASAVITSVVATIPAVTAIVIRNTKVPRHSSTTTTTE